MTNTVCIRSIVAAVAVVYFVAGSPSRVLAASPVVSNAHVHLSGQVAIPDTSEVVTLSGLVHVVTRVVAVDDGHLITVYANLPANVSAEGPQELHFIAHGASKHSDVHAIEDGEIVPCVMPGFTLLLADKANRSISPITFSIRLDLSFSESGELVRGIALVGRGAGVD